MNPLKLRRLVQERIMEMRRKSQEALIAEAEAEAAKETIKAQNEQIESDYREAIGETDILEEAKTKKKKSKSIQSN